MNQWILCCSLSVLAWTSTLLGFSDSVIYTSSKKIEDMVLQEEQILNDLHRAVNELGNETVTSSFNRFYQQRMPKVKERRHDEDLRRYLKHPNGVYHSIKQFATDYENIRSIMKFTTSSSIHKHLSSIADMDDINGARLSFILLQDVYKLNISDMKKGNYLGFVGPELSEHDMLEIGEAAFSGSRWQYAIAWLQEALELSRNTEPTAGFINLEPTRTSSGRVFALLGRAYLRQGNKNKAAEMYRKARSVAFETDEHITALERELDIQPEIRQPDTADENFRTLCYQQNKLTQKTFDPRLTCSYKETILPYYRFKQELVSVSPYVALFYEVITDQEIDSTITIAQQKLHRAVVVTNGTTIMDSYRTSDISFVDDRESPALGRLSKRVADITYLNTSPYQRGKDYEAEPFQVVNYGMGGHYGLHYDFYDDKSKVNDDVRHPHFKYGGNRLATFLIYLTDVELGGSTVFNQAGLAVRPVKKMALFWYSFTPRGQADVNTRHAGCPVVVGHKWVANKWIWLHGNTFTRRCGLTSDATQLDIEPYMRNGWV